MRADLERAVVRRRAHGTRDPVQKVGLLRQVVEMAEAANDYPAFSAALREYEMAVRADPSADVALGKAISPAAPRERSRG